MTDLKGRIALVTGASRGIGRAVAEAYAKAGAHVVLTARTVGALEAVDDAIRAAGGQAAAVPGIGCGFGVERQRHGHSSLVETRSIPAAKLFGAPPGSANNIRDPLTGLSIKFAMNENISLEDGVGQRFETVDRRLQRRQISGRV